MSMKYKSRWDSSAMDLPPRRTFPSASPESRSGAAARPLVEDDGTAASAHALLGIGASEYRMGRPKEALEPLREASRRLAKLSNRQSTLEALLLLGRAERDLGLKDEAAGHFDEALELARAEGEVPVIVDALNLRAGLLNSLGDSVGAYRLLEQALELARGADLPECQSNILNNLGHLRTQFGDHARALENLSAARELIQRLGMRSRAEAVNLINLGHLYREIGDEPRAQEHYTLAREIGRETADRMVEAVSINSLANTLGRSAEWTSARELYHEALEMARSLGFRQYEIDNLDGLGETHGALGEHERACEAYQEALSIARQICDREGKIDALIGLGRNRSALGRNGEAVTHLTEALLHAEELDREASLIAAHELLAKIYENEDNLPKALHHQRELHRVETALLRGRTDQRSRQLSMQYELERARQEADTYRLEVLRKAHEVAKARVQEQSAEIEQSELEIVSRLASAAEYRDDETGEHTRRVGSISAEIARALGWSKDEVKLLSYAARLHDVGKIGLRDSLLLKPDKLTPDEFSIVRAHTVIGASLLSGGRSKLLQLAEEISLAHHERWDGSGYPLRLAGEEIPQSARIVAVADVFDALIHERPYKHAWSIEEALREIREQSGRQFDPKVVEAFFESRRLKEAERRRLTATPGPTRGAFGAS